MCRCQGGKASGCRSRAQSWTVTTTGSCARSGPRIVVQWSTSADRASRAMPNGYQARSRTTVAARPVTVEADRQELELRPALERAREALHDAGRAGAGLGERGDVERDLHRAAS